MNIKWLILILVWSHSANSTNNVMNSDITSKEADTLINSFEFEIGKGTFKQSKSFKFMSMPIISHGDFIIDGERVLWKTTEPVNSSILLADGAVYKKNTADNEFKLLVKESPINHMLSAILTGNIDLNNWSVSTSKMHDDVIPCLTMLPKSQQLMSIFTSATLCIESDKQREVVLLDKQQNKTLIEMKINHKLLTVEDKLSLETP